MGTIKLGCRTIDYQWATDVAFDGIRLEILSDDGDMVFDLSLPANGSMTVNTFGREVEVDLLKVAIETAEQRQ